MVNGVLCDNFNSVMEIRSCSPEIALFFHCHEHHWKMMFTCASTWIKFAHDPQHFSQGQTLHSCHAQLSWLQANNHNPSLHLCKGTQAHDLVSNHADLLCFNATSLLRTLHHLAHLGFLQRCSPSRWKPNGRIFLVFTLAMRNELNMPSNTSSTNWPHWSQFWQNLELMVHLLVMSTMTHLPMRSCCLIPMVRTFPSEMVLSIDNRKTEFPCSKTRPDSLSKTRT